MPPTSGASPGHLGYILLASLLFMLNVTAIFTLTTGMDLYGFYTIEPVAAFPLPLALATLLNLGMAAAGYACYLWLWRRRAWFTGGRWGPFTRGAVLSGIPVALAYAPGVVLTSHGGKPSLIGAAVLIAGPLCVTHALRDSETKLDPPLARYWFIGAVGSILVFLALTIGGMLTIYAVEQVPASGNLLWRYEYEWSDLGYPREEFQQRQRDALVGFTLTGSGFMIAVLGGSMLGAILRWTREPQYADRQPTPGRQRGEPPQWVARVTRRLESLSPPTPGEVEYAMVLGRHEVGISMRQYQCLVADKDDLLDGVDLLVDRSSGSVRLRAGGTWRNLSFRIGRRPNARRSGPFALLCIYARYPGRRFTNGELHALLESELPDHTSINVNDFINQIRSKKPHIPLVKYDGESYLPESMKTLILERRPGYPAKASPQATSSIVPAS